MAQRLQDQEIIALYLARDERAIEQTAQKYGDYCFTVAEHILQNAQDAEECVNDTWLKTWNTIPPKRPDSLKYYLVKITRNLSLSRWREVHAERRGGGEVMVALDEVEEFVADTRQITDDSDRAALSDVLNRFLRKLPERDCNIFLRRYFYLETTEKIAQRYGMKDANVLLILSRIRAKLRTYLNKEGYSV